jgi:hypothetical protein
LSFNVYLLNLFTENSALSLQDEHNDSLPNISTGFFDKHHPLEDEVMHKLMDDLSVEVLNKDKSQVDQIIPSSSTPSLLTPCSRSEVIQPDGNTERMSITPTPLEYNSFTPSPTHDLFQPNQTSESIILGNNAIVAEVNCQSPIITTTDASSAADAPSECSTPSNRNGRKRRQFSIDRSKKKR